MSKSGLQAVLDKKLAAYKDDLYGIYLTINSDNESEWVGRLGEMPGPYILGVTLVTSEEADAEDLKGKFIQLIFNQTVKDPDDPKNQIKKSDFILKFGIRMLEEDIECKSVGEITLVQLRSMVRYSLVDHLSDSTMAS